MLQITNIKEYTIDYKCDCGVSGECMFKPPQGNVVMLIEVRCPMCETIERLKIMKYDSEESKKQLSNNNSDLYWVVTLDNKIKDEDNV